MNRCPSTLPISQVFANDNTPIYVDLSTRIYNLIMEEYPLHFKFSENSNNVIKVHFYYDGNRLQLFKVWMDGMDIKFLQPNGNMCIGTNIDGIMEKVKERLQAAKILIDHKYY